MENFCAAPMMADGKGGIQKRLSYYYIGHFSRYLKPGAKRILASCFTEDLETVAFLNTEGRRVVVLLNRTEKAVPVDLVENGEGVDLELAAHTISTVILV